MVRMCRCLRSYGICRFFRSRCAHRTCSGHEQAIQRRAWLSARACLEGLEAGRAEQQSILRRHDDSFVCTRKQVSTRARAQTLPCALTQV
jgi:hypothetical protein